MHRLYKGNTSYAIVIIFTSTIASREKYQSIIIWNTSRINICETIKNSLKEENVIFKDEIRRENLFLSNWEKERNREINRHHEDEHNSLINYTGKQNNIEWDNTHREKR